MPNQTYDEFKAANPHLKDFLLFLDKLREESPRGMVLISCGFLEEQLRQVLLSFFAENKQHAGLVDGGSAPIGTFSARIATCHALTLINDDERHDLDQLRKIRNEFAHSMQASFDLQNIKDRCSNLRLKAHDYSFEELGEVIVSSQGQFTTAATALILNLVNRPHYVSQQRRRPTVWQH